MNTVFREKLFFYFLICPYTFSFHCSYTQFSGYGTTGVTDEIYIENGLIAVIESSWF